jgi:hypothetical protein
LTKINYEEMRKRQRFSVSLKATGSFEADAREHQLSVSNVSATGARLHADTALDIRVGMRVRLKIFVPGTVLHVPATGEIMWVNRQAGPVAFGVRFADMVSAYMVEQLTRNGVPITT